MNSVIVKPEIHETEEKRIKLLKKKGKKQRKYRKRKPIDKSNLIGK